MSAQHTPGPWRAYSVIPDQWYVSMTGGIVTTLDRRNDSNGEYKARTSADAQLIAAAPELLEALEKLLRAFDRTGVKLASLSGNPTATDNARAAIAKAKGGAES